MSATRHRRAGCPAWRLFAVVVLGLLPAACSGGDGDTVTATNATTIATLPATVTPPTNTTAPTGAIMVTSRAFEAGQAIPKRYSCKGGNVSPPLSWRGVPAAAEELAVVMDDPDAGNFVHWVLVGIDPDTASLGEGRTPAGSVSVNDYYGPCPPGSTPHRYRFVVYALPKPLRVQQGSGPLQVIEQLQAAAIAHGELVGTFTGG